MLRTALTLYGLDHWRIEITDTSANVLVDGLNRVIQVRRDLRIDLDQAHQLVAHEIGRHVLSAENARRQPDPFAQFALGAHQVATEEGVATWLETHLTRSATTPRRHLFAARVLAVLWAQDDGVVDLADRLCERLPQPQAIDLAVRVKRGLRDMNAPGGMTKDYMYLAGLLEVERLLESRPAALDLLQLTKWSLTLLPEVEVRLADGRLEPAAHRLDLLRHALADGTIAAAALDAALPATTDRRGWLRWTGRKTTPGG